MRRSGCPAAGQGVIAVEAREDDARMAELLAAVHHEPSAFAATAERALLAALDGGCQVPIGALLIGEGLDAVLHAMVSDLHGKRMLRGSLVVGDDVGRRSRRGARAANARRRRNRDSRRRARRQRENSVAAAGMSVPTIT